MRSVAVVVPCFNEAERLDAGALLDFLADRPWASFVLVDDGSSDGTAEKLAQIAGSCPDRCAVELRRPNRGKAEAVRAGVRRALEANPSHVGYWDADLATPLSAVDIFVERLEREPHLRFALGSRVKLLGHTIRRSPVRHYGGRVFATLVSNLLDLDVYDTQCGAKLIAVDERTATLFDEPFLSRWVFDVELLFRFLRSGGGVDQIVEIPLTTWVDPGDSRLTRTDLLAVPRDLARIAWRYRVR